MMFTTIDPKTQVFAMIFTTIDPKTQVVAMIVTTSDPKNTGVRNDFHRKCTSTPQTATKHPPTAPNNLQVFRGGRGGSSPCQSTTRTPKTQGSKGGPKGGPEASGSGASRMLQKGPESFSSAPARPLLNPCGAPTPPNSPKQPPSF